MREDIPLPQVVVWGHQGWTKNPLVVAKVTRAGGRRGREGGGRRRRGKDGEEGGGKEEEREGEW